jgi:putative hemolysin
MEPKKIMLYFELGIVTVLIVTNGLLSMSELAIVSSRPARLAALAERNVKGSRRALALASDPGKFLSTVQIGITLIGVLSGAFSGATLGHRLANLLVEVEGHGRCDRRRRRRDRDYLRVAHHR